jgi:hypothetical protein
VTTRKTLGNNVAYSKNKEMAGRDRQLHAVVEPHGHLIRLVHRVCRRHTDIPLLLTHSIEPWTRSRAPNLLVVLASNSYMYSSPFWLTLIPPQYVAQFENDSQFHAGELLVVVNDARGVVAIL